MYNILNNACTNILQTVQLKVSHNLICILTYEQDAKHRYKCGNYRKSVSTCLVWLVYIWWLSVRGHVHSEAGKMTSSGGIPNPASIGQNRPQYFQTNSVVKISDFGPLKSSKIKIAISTISRYDVRPHTIKHHFLMDAFRYFLFDRFFN